MITELQPHLDRSLHLRSGTPADEDRVTPAVLVHEALGF